MTPIRLPRTCIAERFRGIRPAFGYPACPDHSPKRTLFGLLDAAQLGMTLTESCAMTPGVQRQRAAVRPPFLSILQRRAHRQGPGRDYARRQGVSLTEAERWLRPNLSYDPQ